MNIGSKNYCIKKQFFTTALILWLTKIPLSRSNMISITLSTDIEQHFHLNPGKMKIEEDWESED